MNDDRILERLLSEWLDRDSADTVESFIARHAEHEKLLREHFELEVLAAHAFAPRPALPETLGPFRIEKELGSGGMGSVYRATVAEPVRGIATGRTVALKVVHPHLFRTQGFFKRFLREAELGQRIDHPNVVRTLDADAVEIDDRPQHYLVMEYVEGQTLRDLVEDVDRVPEELARHVGCEVAKALSAIHAAGAVHRDLKPENVLITPDHQVKVMDLGVARLADEQVRLSQTGAFVGSLHYAAPEQFGGGADVDSRADLHGLGILLYEIATGTNPFADEDARVVMRRILSDAPRKAGELNPQLSPFFEELLVQLLEKDPAARFESATDVLAILDDAETSDWWRSRAKEIRAVSKRPLRRIRVPRETAVYGRDTELAQLRALYDAAKTGDGRVVLVEGEAGIGKTRLVDEFVARLQQDGEDVNFLFASYPPGGAATAAGAFSAAYREHLGDDHLEESLTELLPQLPLLVPAFAALLRGDAAPREVQPVTRDSLQTCFVNLTRGLSSERTTIVLIDDLHFAPEEGRALFTSVALAVPGHRVLLVGTMRPGVPKAWTAGVTRLQKTSHVRVPRLWPKDLVRLLRDSFKSQRLAEELAGKIAVKSDGNPFFAFEIIRGLREGQFISQSDDGSWHTTRLIEDIQVPSSVLDLVNARVAELADDDRNLLDVAACWGYEFDPSLIGDALGLPRLLVLQRLAKIEKRDRLVRAQGRGFVFDHHQVQESLYEALPAMLQEEYHAALAGALEERIGTGAPEGSDPDGATCVDLCHHFLAGGRGQSAMPYLEGALSHLEQGHLPHDLVHLAERALAAPGLVSGRDRAQLLLRLGGALGPLYILRRVERCTAVGQESLAIAKSLDDAELECRAAICLGGGAMLAREYRAARAWFERGRSRAQALRNREFEAQSVGNLGVIARSEGHHAEAIVLCERALSLSRETGNRQAVGTGLGLIGDLERKIGQLAQARLHVEESLAIARELGERDCEAIRLGYLAQIDRHEGNFERAAESLDERRRIAREIGFRSEEMSILGALGVVRDLQGRRDDAWQLYEEQRTLAEALAGRNEAADAVMHQGLVSIGRGRASRAETELTQALSAYRDLEDEASAAVALVNLGLLHLLLGLHDIAESELSQVVDVCRSSGVRRVEGYALERLGRVALQRGDLDNAFEILEQSVELRREIRYAWGVSASLTHLGRALMDIGRAEAAAAAFAEAAAIAVDVGAPVLRVQSLCAAERLRPDSASEAAESLDEFGERVPHVERMQAEHDLWLATGDPARLGRAKRLLDDFIDHAPPRGREPMLREVPLHRQIVEAWAEHSESSVPAPAESETRPG